MINLKKLPLLLLLPSLLIACSNAPEDSIVEGLIKAQYEQAHSMSADAHSEVLMPTLESVSGVKCGSAEGADTYRCIAEITQSKEGNSETKKVNFLVYKYEGEWVIGG